MRETDPGISKADRLHHEGNASSLRERDAAALSKEELESLPQEEYLRLTGVSTAMETAFALVTSLRPRSPLELFNEIIQDHARDTHPILRQVKLLLHATCPLTIGGLNVYHGSRGYYGGGAFSGGGDEDAAAGSSILPKLAVEEATSAGSRRERNKAMACQLEELCEPIFRYLCSHRGKQFEVRARGSNGKCPKKSGDHRSHAADAANRNAFGGVGVGCYTHGGHACWGDVRRLLEVLCRGAGIDDECTKVAMATLEREGKAGLTAKGGEDRRRVGRQQPMMDFVCFVDAVRAILLFKDFNQAAKDAFVDLTGSTGDPAPLDKLMHHLLHSAAGSPSEGRWYCDQDVRGMVQRRLDLGRTGETKVRLTALTDCVFSAAFRISSGEHVW